MIQKILFALGAVATFEGLLLALAPQRTVEVLKKFSELSSKQRSYFGLFTLMVGVVIFWISGI